ncbi:hypothetical protein AGMMS49938_18330 [Fibrobacterales bacterium]|nr:hypothetical protein AGMMS49938_18330 [Fibrobacterales bacterium]
MEDIESLLYQITVINKRYEEIFKSSGENFNVFNILNLTSDELSHSRFIAELLNPKGSHGKGNIFLKSFLEKIKIDYFSLENTIVEVEKNIGNIDENYDSGGRIDIAVTNDKEQILIETKIYAKDQYRQLWRYYEYGKKSKLVYLTLDGREASEDSLFKLTKDDYIKISYEKEILEWLECSQKESVNDSILRETLRQYIILIRQLTGQSRSREMEKEMVDVILKNKNVAAAFDIVRILPKIKEKVIENTITKLKELANSKSLQFNADDFFEYKFSKFSFYRNDRKYLKLRFEFQEKDLKGLLYGFPYNVKKNDCENESDKFPKDLIDFLKTKGYNKSNGYKENDWWPLYKFADSYKDGNIFVELAEKCDEFVKYVGNAIDELLEIIDEFNTAQNSDKANNAS